MICVLVTGVVQLYFISALFYMYFILPENFTINTLLFRKYYYLEKRPRISTSNNQHKNDLKPSKIANLI